MEKVVKAFRYVTDKMNSGRTGGEMMRNLSWCVFYPSMFPYEARAFDRKENVLQCKGFIPGKQAKSNKMQMSPSAPLLSLPPPPPQVRPGANTKKEGEERGCTQLFYSPRPLFLSKG
ncbi:hypothetical protein Q8A73_002525 [Channa argus]|nr:hypothetical protein Q8A73_002525 [Channa argus]